MSDAEGRRMGFWERLGRLITQSAEKDLEISRLRRKVMLLEERIDYLTENLRNRGLRDRLEARKR